MAGFSFGPPFGLSIVLHGFVAVWRCGCAGTVSGSHTLRTRGRQARFLWRRSRAFVSNAVGERFGNAGPNHGAGIDGRKHTAGRERRRWDSNPRITDLQSVPLVHLGTPPGDFGEGRANETKSGNCWSQAHMIRFVTRRIVACARRIRTFKRKPAVGVRRSERGSPRLAISVQHLAIGHSQAGG